MQTKGGTMKVSFVMHPNPALLDSKGVPYGPIRTNIFPQPQFTLASTLMRDHDVNILDLRTIDIPASWRNELGSEYAPPINYGDKVLTRHLIGNYQAKIAHSPGDVDVYVLSANFTYEANAIRQTIREIKKHAPKATLLVGGTDASPQERHQFYFNAGADYIGLGDADVSLPHFLKMRESGKINVSRVIPEGGRIHVLDLKELARMYPDLTRFSESGGGKIVDSISQKGFAAYIEMQRGCNRECDFCTAAKTPFDRLSVDEIKRQIDNYIDNGVSLFMFTDDNTVLRKEEELLEIFEYMGCKGTSWEFPNGLEFGLFGKRDASGNFIPKTSLLDALFWNNGNRENYAGAHRVLFPVEDSLLRQSSLRKLRPGAQHEALEELIQRKIPYINMGIMIGAVNETAQERQNLEANLDHILAEINTPNTGLNYSLFCTMPLPGTGLGRQLQTQGRVKYSIDDCPELWNVFTSVVQGDTFSPEETTEFRRNILVKYGMQQDSGKVNQVTARKDFVAQELLRYGMVHKNVEFYTKKVDFAQWFANQLEKLRANPDVTSAQDAFECYFRLNKIMKADETKVLPIKKKERGFSSVVSNVMAMAASVALALGLTKGIDSEITDVQKQKIDSLPAWVFTQETTTVYNTDFFVKRAKEEASWEIFEKYGMSNTGRRK